MMKTHWRAQSQRTHSVRRSDTRTKHRYRLGTGVTTNKHTEALHSSTSDDPSPEEQCRKAQHSTGQSPRTIPSFSACIRTLKQRFSRQDWLQASGVSVSVFEVGIGIRYFAIIYNFWCNTATAMRVGSFDVHVGLWITLQATPLISWATQCWGDVSSTLSGVNCPIIIIDNHNHGPPRT